MGPVARIAELLGLPTSGQDWGVEHADPARLGEFLALAASLNPTHPYEFEMLSELIFASAEDAHAANQLTPELELELKEFVRARGSLFPVALGHWRRMPQGEWYLPCLLRAIV